MVWRGRGDGAVDTSCLEDRKILVVLLLQGPKISLPFPLAPFSVWLLSRWTKPQLGSSWPGTKLGWNLVHPVCRVLFVYNSLSAYRTENCAHLTDQSQRFCFQGQKHISSLDLWFYWQETQLGSWAPIAQCPHKEDSKEQGSDHEGETLGPWK